MPLLTTNYYGPPKTRPLSKPFAWSYSRLKNFRACPLKHYMTDLAKSVPQEKTQALDDGFYAHDQIAKLIKGQIEHLPARLHDYEAEVRRIVWNGPAETKWIVEENMAIRRDFTACDTFDPGVWLRAKCDFVKILGPVAAAFDWKTGGIKEDSEQLGLMAQCIFSAYPEVRKVGTQYVWLGHRATTTAYFLRQDMRTLWLGLMPEIERYENAYKTGDFPAKPSGLCKRHCNVTACQYYGKGNYG